MNIQDNDFILAIKNYEDIILSMPVLSENLNITDLPELYRLFITISVLLKDYDKDLIDLLHNKWETIDESYKLKLIGAVNNISCDDKDCVFFNGGAEISVAKKEELTDLLNFSKDTTRIIAESADTDRSIRG